MKKKVMCMLLTGVMAAGMFAGCGSSDTADTTTDAAATTDAASTADAADTTSEAAPAENADFDHTSAIAVYSREDGSGTRGAFIELFGVEEKDESGEKVDNTTEEAIITNSTDVMLTSVAGDTYAIGYVSLGSLNDTVKAVKIDGAEATVENIKSGTYKIARPFNIATKGEVSEAAQDFINYIMSEDGQKIISANKYIEVANSGAFTSTNPKGKIVVAGSSSVTPVMEKLIEAYKAINTNADIELQESDSTTGITSTSDGTCDIGMASRELKDTETALGLKATVIAMDGIAVIVNNNNSAEDYTVDQVKDIFTGSAAKWEDVK